MANENLENKSDKIQQNPSRENPNFGQDQSKEKKFDTDKDASQTAGSDESAQLGNKDVNMDRGSVSSSQSDQSGSGQKDQSGGGIENDDSKLQ